MTSSSPTLRQPPKGGFLNWAQRINSRWIVHHGLDASARSFMEHLETSDPQRLERACRLAWQAVGLGQPGEDPKPLFYGGLFVLATPAEKEHFLARHLFTHLACSNGEENEEYLCATGRISDLTYRKALTLRGQIQGLLEQFN